MSRLVHWALGSVLVLGLGSGNFVPAEGVAWAKADCASERARADGVWRVVDARGAVPSGRSAPAVAAHGRAIYVFGGSHDDVVTGEVTLYDDFHYFDTRQRRWREVEREGDWPSARAFAPMVNDAAAGRLVMYGGATFGDFFSDFMALDDLWTFDAGDDVWSLVHPEGDGPGGRSGATLWIDEGRLYLFGGIDSSYRTYNDVWAFDFTSNVWSLVSADGRVDAPPPRHEAYSGGIVRDGEVTLYGGESVTEDFNFVTLPDTWQYDVATNTWTEVTPAPQYDISPPRNLGAAAFVDGSLFIHGGDVPGGELCGAVFAQNPTDELWRFDLNAERWERQTPRGAPVARLKRSRGAAIGGVMYILGGYDFTCTDGVGVQAWNADVFAYDPRRERRR